MRRRVIAAGLVVMALTTCCRAAQGPAEVVKEFVDQCKAGEVDKAKGHVYEIEGDHPEAGET